jgi:hypothetical protein
MSEGFACPDYAELKVRIEPARRQAYHDARQTADTSGEWRDGVTDASADSISAVAGTGGAT